MGILLSACGEDLVWRFNVPFSPIISGPGMATVVEVLETLPEALMVRDGGGGFSRLSIRSGVTAREVDLLRR